MPDTPSQHASEDADAAQAAAAAELRASQAQRVADSPFAPLAAPVFRMLWLASLTANVCMWMNDVASAWLMTTLTDSPVLVALVQTASTLPVFLLGLPSGALADILDRRRYLMVTQFWVAAVAIVLCVAVLGGALTPWALLVLTFVNGIGLAMRWPVFSAIVPELVERPQLPAALALNSVAMNVSRVVGPLTAGAIIASAGTAWVYVLNALLSLAAGIAIQRWRRAPTHHPLGREPLGSAMRVGWQFVRESPRMRGVLWRISVYFLHAATLLALLPLVARDIEGGGAAAFTVLLASMGAGAVGAAMVLPRLRRSMSTEAMVRRGTLVQALGMALVAAAPSLALAVPAMLLAGAAWMSTTNTLTVAAQLALPHWVRARGMSIYQMAIMGATAAGAAIWGQVASLTSVHLSMALAALSGVLAMALVQRRVRDSSADEDLTPSHAFQQPRAAGTPTAGRRLVTCVEYLVPPAREAEFRALMQESRRSRLGSGALTWELQHDIADPRRFIERVVDASWTEYLRRFDRYTASDAALRDRKLAFHVGDEPPLVTRYVVEDD